MNDRTKKKKERERNPDRIPCSHYHRRLQREPQTTAATEGPVTEHQPQTTAATEGPVTEHQPQTTAATEGPVTEHQPLTTAATEGPVTEHQPLPAPFWDCAWDNRLHTPHWVDDGQHTQKRETASIQTENNPQNSVTATQAMQGRPHV